MWPKKGDYDFNDLVVYFRTTRVLNANNKVVDLKQNLTIGAVGASFDNGFGFQLDEVTSSAVKNVSGNVLSRNLVMQNANKTEGGHTKAVIIAFDSPEPLIKRTAGPMFNTVKSSSPGTSTPLDLTITFLTPQDEEKVAQKNINPFLFINRNRGREVHLSDYQPTALADTKLLGTGDDASNPNAKRYYKTRQNFPWALEVPNRFRQPAETVNITEAFNFFSKWVTTRGAQHDDWFEEKSGYINADKVYR
jgi:LruC domain-containing protein